MLVTNDSSSNIKWLCKKLLSGTLSTFWSAIERLDSFQVAFLLLLAWHRTKALTSATVAMLGEVLGAWDCGGGLVFLPLLMRLVVLQVTS